MKNKDSRPFVDNTAFLFLPFVALVLVNLKLFEVIDWSWWWVLSPLVFHVIGILLVLFALLLMSVAAVLLSTSAVVRFLEKKFRTLSEKENQNV